MTTDTDVIQEPVSLTWNRPSTLTWNKWQSDFEAEFNGERRQWMGMSMLHNVFDFRTDSGADRLLYVLHLADFRSLPERDRVTWRYSTLRLKALEVLAGKFFGNSQFDEFDRECFRLMCQERVATAVWSFLSVSENYPASEKKQYWDAMARYVGRSYSWAVQGYSRYRSEKEVERLRELRSFMVEALAYTGQLRLAFDHDDISSEMISALERYAEKATSLDLVKKENPTAQDVLSFGYKHESAYREAAAWAHVLRAIRMDRTKLAQEKQKEVDRVKLP